MSSNEYKKEKDLHFKEWWESEENDLLSLVTEEIAKEIWDVAYRWGGKQPWWTLNQSQMQILMKNFQVKK
jgi:hypothetical protein